MSPPGYPVDGVNFISVNGHCVGDKKVGNVDNIVVNNQRTPFYFRWLYDAPTGSVYEISLGTHCCKNFVQHDKEWVNIKGGYQQWVLWKVSPGTYTIAPKENTTIYWTDMGPHSPADCQIQLKHMNAKDPSHQFHISQH